LFIPNPFKKHPPLQHLDCLGCGKAFNSAADFMRHIEFAQCSLTLRAVRGQIIHKTIVKDLLKNPEIFEDVTKDYDVDDDEDGGVSLLEGLDDRANLANVPALAAPKADDAKTASSKEMWPVLNVNASSSPGQVNLLGDSMAAMKLKENKRSNSSSSAPWIKGSASKNLFPDAKPTPIKEGVIEDGNQTNLLHHQLWNPESEMYQASAFYNELLECYICPFTSCRYVFHP
jgi:hypothetical protein